MVRSDRSSVLAGANDVLTARQRLNFSTLGSKPAAAQKATLFEAVNMIQLRDAVAEVLQSAPGFKSDAGRAGDAEGISCPMGAHDK